MYLIRLSSSNISQRLVDMYVKHETGEASCDRRQPENAHVHANARPHSLLTHDVGGWDAWSRTSVRCVERVR